MPTEVKTFLPNSDWSSDFKPPSILPRCALVCGFPCLCPDKGLQCFLKPFTSFGKSSLSLQIMLSLSSWLCGPQLHIFRFSIIFHISRLTLFPVFSIFFLCEFQSLSFWPSYESTIHLFSYILPGMKFTTEFLSSITVVLSPRISIQLYICVYVYIYVFS